MLNQFGVTGEPGGQALFYYLGGLAWDAGRKRLYVADADNGVRIYDPALGTLSRLDIGDVALTSNLAFDGGSQLYIAGGSGVARVNVDTLARVGLAGGTGTNDGVGADGHLLFAGPIALDLAGNALYIADANLRKLDLATNRLTTLDRARDFVWGGNGLALDGAGGLFIGSYVAEAIAHESLDGSGRTIIAGPAQVHATNAAAYADGIGAAARFATPAQLAASGNTLYVADTNNYVIRTIDVPSAGVGTFAGLPWGFDRDGRGSAGRLVGASHLAGDGEGGYIVVETNGNTIRRWSPSGNRVTTLAGSFDVQGSSDGRGTRARFWQPGGACVYDGAAYVADTGNHTLRKIVLRSGAVTTFAGKAESAGHVDGSAGAARFNQPTDVLCDGAGSLYVADSGSYSLRKIDLAGGGVTTISRQGLVMQPVQLARDATWLYILDGYQAGVRRYRFSDGSVDSLADLADAEVLSSITTDGSGNVFVGDCFGTLHRIAADGTVATLANPKGYFGDVDGPLANAEFEYTQALLYDGDGGILVGTDSSIPAHRSRRRHRRHRLRTRVQPDRAQRHRRRRRARAAGRARARRPRAALRGRLWTGRHRRGEPRGHAPRRAALRAARTAAAVRRLCRRRRRRRARTRLLRRQLVRDHQPL